MTQLLPHKTGLAVGSMAGIVHIVWALLVALDWAQPFSDWVVSLHMVEPMHVVASFNPFTAVILVVMASLVGYAIGYVFASIWNAVQKM